MVRIALMVSVLTIRILDYSRTRHYSVYSTKRVILVFVLKPLNFKSEAPLRGLLLRLWNWVLDHELEVALRAESTRLKLRALASHGIGHGCTQG